MYLVYGTSVSADISDDDRITIEAKPGEVVQSI